MHNIIMNREGRTLTIAPYYQVKVHYITLYSLRNTFKLTEHILFYRVEMTFDAGCRSFMITIDRQGIA